MEERQSAPIGVPYDTDVGIPVRKFEVLENGDVVMVETQTTTLKFIAPEFRSFRQNHQKEVDRLTESMSKEVLSRTKESRTEILKLMNSLKPVIEESEKKTEANYKKMMTDGAVKAIKEYFTKPKSERKPEYIAAILENLRKEEKMEEVIAQLNPEESNVVVKIKIAMLRKQRESKKKK